MGVRGRNSDNTLIKKKLNWAPSISIHTGLKTTLNWIKEQVLHLFLICVMLGITVCLESTNNVFHLLFYVRVLGCNDITSYANWSMLLVDIQIEGEVSSGLSSSEYAHSEVVVQVTDTLDELNK